MDDEKTSRPFEARFDGPCGNCDGGIEEGDSIVMFDGEAFHEMCARAEGLTVPKPWRD